MNIRFNVLHQRLIRCDSSALTEGSKNYLNCSFTFSEDWNTLEKAALFLKQGDTVPYPALISDNACKIPDAVCQTGGRWEMALIGAGGDVINKLVNGMSDLKNANIVITTNSCCLRFGETVSVNTINEDESKENPFADVLAKITALSDSYEIKQNKTDDALTTEDKTVVGAINETHSKARDAMSTAETALNYTSVNEMLMGSLDNLTTQEKSTIVGAINEINSNKQPKDFTINCDVTIDDRDNMNILLVSATSTDITNALHENKNVVLNVATEFGAFVTNLIITNNYEFVFLYNDAQYTIVCGSNEGWYGYVTPLATDYDISTLETQIGELSALNTQDKSTIVAAINELDNEKVSTFTLYGELAPKQNQVDTSLTTTDKTIVGAINELDAEIGDINTALDSILAMQNELIGGDSE